MSNLACWTPLTWPCSDKAALYIARSKLSMLDARVGFAQHVPTWLPQMYFHRLLRFRVARFLADFVTSPFSICSSANSDSATWHRHCTRLLLN
jgi:hypothetical protein